MGLQHAQEYYAKNGNLQPPNNYKCNDNYGLGSFLANLRTKYKNGKLSLSQIADFEKIGMVWNVYEFRWNAQFAQLEAYLKEHGSLPKGKYDRLTKEERHIQH